MCIRDSYEQRFQLAPGIEARFVDVGHLLGSASIEPVSYTHLDVYKRQLREGLTVS